MRPDLPGGFVFAGCFDTETTQLTDAAGGGPRAFAVSYQWNDLRGRDLLDYEPGRDDRLHMSPDPLDFMRWLWDVARWGEELKLVPVVTAYNLAFDLQTLMKPLQRIYPDMRATAQSGRSLYTLDLYSGDTPKLRFWDSYHLNKSGLKVMGLLAGVPKLTGEWDYARVRVPSTPLTACERDYALRDVQVIPAYLRYILEANPWIGQDEFGHTVQTATSLVRRYGRTQIGALYASGSKTLWESFLLTCKTETPKTWESYAVRKACFRGGLCFTSAKTASLAVENVASLDVTSMHHTFMARLIPVGFKPADAAALNRAARDVLQTPRAVVLGRYYQPFTTAFHAGFRFHGLRLKNSSFAAAWGIGLPARSRFLPTVETYNPAVGEDVAEEAGLDSVMRAGYHDEVHGGVFAFSKLMEAREAVLYLSELELWTMSRAYEWNSMEPVAGELTTQWRKAPDYVGLMSRTLYAQKAQTKALIRAYKEGEPYAGPIGDRVPRAIADAARDGTLTGGNHAGNHGSTLDAYYLHLKQMFNAIYGTLAQDEFKPRFKVADARVTVDPDTVCTPETFEQCRPKAPRVLYTQGLRIVGGSRLHLVLGMELLYEALGDRIDVLGGDTDSLKIRCDPDVTDEELRAALQPLHDAADWCLERGYYRARTNYPGAYIGMPGVGHFEVEDCGTDAAGRTTTRYTWHVELWNKARVSFDAAGRAHVTCAGLSRPAGLYTIETWYEDAARARGPRWALDHGLGYNVLVKNDVCHMLGRTAPKPTDTIDEDVQDYTGRVEHVERPAAVCLYNVDKMIGDPAGGPAFENLEYLRRVYGREPAARYRVIAAADWKEGRK